MNMIIQIVTAIALTLSIIVPFGCFFLGEKKQKTLQKVSDRQLFPLLRCASRGNHRKFRRNSKRTGCFLFC